MRLERHAAVIAEDLPHIYASVARDNPAAAERVLDAVEATFEQLTRQPECGVTYRSRDRNLPDMRMLPVTEFTNYLVFYRIEVRSCSDPLCGSRRAAFAPLLPAGTSRLTLTSDPR